MQKKPLSLAFSGRVVLSFLVNAGMGLTTGQASTNCESINLKSIFFFFFTIFWRLLWSFHVVPGTLEMCSLSLQWRGRDVIHFIPASMPGLIGGVQGSVCTFLASSCSFPPPEPQQGWEGRGRDWSCPLRASAWHTVSSS